MPQNSRLRVDIKLPPTPIEQVSLDQVTRLRFPGINQRITAELRGKIVHISPATTTALATGQSYYQATVAITPDELAKLQDSRLIPGMSVEVFVTTEDRTVASYLPKPIMQCFAHALRERSTLNESCARQAREGSGLAPQTAGGPRAMRGRS